MNDSVLLASLADIEVSFRINGQVASAETIWQARKRISHTSERALPSPTVIGTFYGYSLYKSLVAFDSEHYESNFPEDRMVVITPFYDASASTTLSLNHLLDRVRNKEKYKNPEFIVENISDEINWLLTNGVREFEVKIHVYHEMVAFVFEDQGKAALFKLYFK